MPERLGKSGLGFFMTADAELIGFSGQQVNDFLRLMNAVTIGTGQLVLAVQAHASAGVRLYPAVATQAALVDLSRGASRKRNDLGTISSVDVVFPRTVAGLAAKVFPSLLRIDL